MPRLLLVDDNPSIHRIAESLLAHTDVELVCVDSAAEALDRIGRGERFDVALVDTTMPGMDGWALLGRLRAMEETAHMPIALMAGVLDPVDPAKLAKAPVQGFLKKPIELRELGDRVKALLAMPVASTPDPSPFITMPARPAKDLVRMAEEAFPEFRPEEAVEPAPQVPEPGLAELVAAPEDDLLVLTAEDLWPEDEPATPEPAEAPAPEIHLELEELDLESLQDLTEGPLLAEAAPPEPAAFSEAASSPSLEDQTPTRSTFDELEDLPADLDLSLPPEPEPPAEGGIPSGVLAATGTAGFAAVAAAMLGDAPDPSPAHAPEPVPEFEPDLVFDAAPEFEALPEFEPAPQPAPETALAAGAAAPGQAPAASGQVPAATSEQSQLLLQTLLADPVLVDALVKAVIARMGDQVIREIAWELMPDVAGRLQR